MATPRAVARDLRRSATRIAKLTDPIVADAATFAVERGAEVGGTFGRKRLAVVVRSQSNRRGQSTVTVGGKPAGAWTIKTAGRRGGYLVAAKRRRALDLRAYPVNTGPGQRLTTAVASVTVGATAGDDRWRRLVAEPTVAQFAVIGRERLADAVEG